MNRPHQRAGPAANQDRTHRGTSAARPPTTRPASRDLGRHHAPTHVRTPHRHTAAARRHRPPPAPEIPWYLQRPDAPTAPPAAEHPTPTTEPKSTDTADRKGLIPWLLVGMGALAVLIGVAVLLANLSKLGITGGTVLDVTKVQTGVLQTLSDPASGYGANTVTDVSCNGGRNPSAGKGTTFVCDATVNGARRHVSVVVSDDNGTYEIDRPR